MKKNLKYVSGFPEDICAFINRKSIMREQIQSMFTLGSDKVALYYWSLF